MNEFRGQIFGQYEILEELGRGGWASCIKPVTRGSNGSWR